MPDGADASKVLAIIPARAGSKGIPGKNIRELRGKPLLAHSVEAAEASGIVDRIVCSTDSKEIASVATEWGAEVPFLRPSHLATDEAPMQPVLEHAVRCLEDDGWSPDIVLNVQPTQPLRKPEHIRHAVEKLQETGADSVVTVVPVPGHYNPEFVLRLKEGRLESFMEEPMPTRRQDVTPAYSRDGTVYAMRRDVLLEEHDIYGDDCRPIVLDRDESVNLDTMEDWRRAKNIVEDNEEM